MFTEWAGLVSNITTCCSVLVKILVLIADDDVAEHHENLLVDLVHQQDRKVSGVQLTTSCQGPTAPKPADICLPVPSSACEACHKPISLSPFDTCVLDSHAIQQDADRLELTGQYQQSWQQVRSCHICVAILFNATETC